MKKPADAARTPLGPTQTITGTSDARMSSTIARIEPGSEGQVRVVTGADTREHDRVIVTAPFAVARKLTAGWPGGSPVPSLAKVDYMGIICLILAIRERIAERSNNMSCKSGGSSSRGTAYMRTS